MILYTVITIILEYSVVLVALGLIIVTFNLCGRKKKKQTKKVTVDTKKGKKDTKNKVTRLVFNIYIYIYMNE